MTAFDQAIQEGLDRADAGVRRARGWRKVVLLGLAVMALNAVLDLMAGQQVLVLLMLVASAIAAWLWTGWVRSEAYWRTVRADYERMRKQVRELAADAPREDAAQPTHVPGRMAAPRLWENDAEITDLLVRIELDMAAGKVLRGRYYVDVGSGVTRVGIFEDGER